VKSHVFAWQIIYYDHVRYPRPPIVRGEWKCEQRRLVQDSNAEIGIVYVTVTPSQSESGRGSLLVGYDGNHMNTG
jgi:hypothetical protein